FLRSRAVEFVQLVNNVPSSVPTSHHPSHHPTLRPGTLMAEVSRAIRLKPIATRAVVLSAATKALGFPVGESVRGEPV
ncbi:MAG TPA: hypothetical protein VJ646_00600, partial [Candidatus Binatia bacterium]|nr:hypothetical protein [Candidatus Binatia bacterium]